MQIANVDMDSGIERSAGMKEVYLYTLEAFIEDGNERKDEMKKCLESGDLSAYEIHAHGIKSALYSIGADEASQAAFELETAAKRGDLDFIKANHDTFIESLSTLIEDVERFLENNIH